MANKKQNDILTDSNEPIEEAVVNTTEAVLDNIVETENTETDPVTQNDDPNVVIEPKIEENSAEIIDGKNAPLTKIEALVMFLAIAAIVFACCFYAMFNMNTKVDHLLDYSKLLNQKITHLESQVENIQIQTEQSVFDKSAFLGITYIESEENGLFLGVKVESVLESSPAEHAGIKAGDYIVAVDGEKIDSFAKLGNIITAHNAGDTLHITIATVENGQIINKNVHAELTYRGNYDLPSPSQE